MPHTVLTLIRHGHTADNGGHARPCLSGITDVPLTALGKREAALVAQRLTSEGVRFAAIYTSPLSRARETANALVDARLGPLVVVDGLREIDCGRYDGVPIEQVKRELPELWAANLRQDDPNFAWPEGESYRAFRERCLESIRAIAARHRGGHVAVITHAGVISQVLGTLAGLHPARWEPFRPGNAAITEVHWRGTSGSLVRYDDRTHLSEPETSSPAR